MFGKKLDRRRRNETPAVALEPSDRSGRSMSELTVRNPAPDAAAPAVPTPTYREIKVDLAQSSGTT